jgi:hypothetical protein
MLRIEHSEEGIRNLEASEALPVLEVLGKRRLQRAWIAAEFRPM